MLESFQNLFKVEELRKRILFTLFMLFVFRVGAHIPTPGIDSDALAEFFKAQADNRLLGFLSMFSGGALERLTVFALGIMPYISASIIIQLLTAVFPYLERLSKEGDEGRKKITKFTRYGTIVLSIVQGLAMAVGIQSMAAPNGLPIVISSMGEWTFRIVTVITFTAGTAFLMWIGEQINERGIGNGISLIIFAGIIASVPSATIDTYRNFTIGEISIFGVLFVAILMILVIGCIIFVETANRKLPVQYARRQQGKKVFGGQSSHLPLKVNSAGVIPPIFASSLLAFPATITSFVDISWVQKIGGQLTPPSIPYSVLFVIMIFFFCFFYTAIQFNPVKIADDMKRYGGFIPGIRPGKKTSEYINLVLGRLTFGGAIYLSMVCLLPSILIEVLKVPFQFGGTALLIVIGVALDTTNQMETFLLHGNYDGFMRKKRKNKY